MANTNQIYYRGLPFQMQSLRDGIPQPSNDIYYGPWDVSEDQIISTLQETLGVSSLPDGATVARWVNGTRSSIQEYHIIDNQLVAKSGGAAQSNDIRAIFAYLVNSETDQSKIAIPTITRANSFQELIRAINNTEWTASFNVEVDYDRQVIWACYGLFKVEQNGNYTLYGLDGTTNNAQWSKPFLLSGGGVSSSTSVSNDIYRCSLSNYNVSIPKSIDGKVSNKALKEASYTILQVFYNGEPVASNNISSIALQDSFAPITDGNGNGFRVRTGQDITTINGIEVPAKVYWLEWADTDHDKLSTDQVLAYTKSVDDDSVLSKVNSDTFFAVGFLVSVGAQNMTIMQQMRFTSKEYSYKITVAPGVINIPSTNLAPAITCTANKLYWDGTIQKYAVDTTNAHYFKLSFANGNTAREIWSEDENSEPITTTNGSWTFSQDEMQQFLSGGDNVNDYIEAYILSPDKEIEDHQAVAVFYQSKLRTESFSDFDCDLIGENVLVNKALLGNNLTPEAKASLKKTSYATLTITYHGQPLSGNQYRITEVKEIGQSAPATSAQFKLVDGDVELNSGYLNNTEHDYSANYPKSFYCTKVFGDTGVEVDFEYVDPNDSSVTYTGQQSQKIIVLDSNEFYDIKVFPSQIRLNKDRIYVYGNSAQLSIDYYVGTTTQQITNFSDFDVTLVLYKNDRTDIASITYHGTQPVPADDNPLIGENGIITLPDLSNATTDNKFVDLDYAVFTLKKNGVYQAQEDCDIYIMPEDGKNGYSPYVLNFQHSLVIDDDTTASSLKNASYFVPELKYEDVVQEMGTYLINIVSQSIYDENDQLVEFTVDNTKQGLFAMLADNQNNKPVGFYLIPNPAVFDSTVQYPFKDHQYYGTITYAAYVVGGSGIAATLQQNIRIQNYSDGRNYVLNVTPNVLYKDVLGTLQTNKNTVITFNAIESIGDQVSNLVLDVDDTVNKNYILLSFVGTNYTYKITQEQAQLGTIAIDFSNSTFLDYVNSSTIINCRLFVNGFEWDTEPISFSYQGETGESVSSNYALTLDNDYIIIDDDTVSSDLAIVSQTQASIYYEGQQVNVSDNNPLSVTVSGNLDNIFEPVTNQSNLSYHLTFKPNASIVETSGTVNVSITFDDENNNTVVLSKSQKVLIKDIGNGEVYKLIVSPNSVSINSNGIANSSSASISVNMIKNGEVTRQNLNDNSIQIQFIGYVNSQNDSESQPMNISIANMDTTQQQGYEYKINLTGTATGNAGIPYTILTDFSALEVQAVKNGLIIDSETIQFVKDGQDGNGVEYVYLLSDTINPNLTIAYDCRGYVKVGNKYQIVQQTNSVAKTNDDFLPIIEPVFSEDYDKLVNDTRKYKHWSDDLIQPTETSKYVYWAQRKWNSLNHRWNNFGNPVLMYQHTTDGTSPYLLTIDNDVVVLDDNATNGVIEQVSKANIKLLKGVEDVTNQCFITSENSYETNKPYVVTISEEGGQYDLFDVVISNNAFYLQLKENTYLSADDPYRTIHIRAEYEGNIIAETVQKVKIFDISEDGSSYKLMLSNDVLYRRYDGKILEAGFDEDIEVKLQKISGDLAEIKYETINTVASRVHVMLRVMKDNNPDNDEVQYYTSSDGETVVFPANALNRYNQTNCKGIYVEAYAVNNSGYNLVLFDREQITFSIAGEQGSSGITASLTNDTIIVDDNITNDLLNSVSTGLIQVFKGTEKLTYKAQDSDYSVGIALPNGSNIGAESAAVNGDYQVYLKKINENADLIAGETYTITYTITVGTTVLYKYQKLKVVDVSEDGSSYRLLLTPDVITATNSGKADSEQTITIEAQEISPNEIRSVIADNNYTVTAKDDTGTSLTIENNTIHYDANANLPKYIVVQLTKKVNNEDVVVDQETISIVKEGKQGDSGKRGATIRTFYKSLKHPMVDFQYKDGTDDFIDFIIIDEGDQPYAVYQCKSSVKYTSTVPNNWYEDSEHWMQITSEQAAYYQNLLAANAKIDSLAATYLTTKSITLKDSQENIYGQFTAIDDEDAQYNYPLWLGQKDGKPVFAVDKDGNLTCNNASSKFYGTAIAKQQTITLSQLKSEGYLYEDGDEYKIYFCPCLYGSNVLLKQDDEFYLDPNNTPNYKIYIDFPAYITTRNKHLSQNQLQQINYANQFINLYQKLQFDLNKGNCTGVYFRGILSTSKSQNNNVANTLSLEGLLLTSTGRNIQNSDQPTSSLIQWSQAGIVDDLHGDWIWEIPVQKTDDSGNYYLRPIDYDSDIIFICESLLPGYNDTSQTHFANHIGVYWRSLLVVTQHLSYDTGNYSAYTTQDMTGYTFAPTIDENAFNVTNPRNQFYNT